LLQPIEGDEPCGPGLEEDADYLALEIAARRKPETEVAGVVTPAEEPDWSAVKQSAVELLGRSKDLQISILLTEALIHDDGLAGFGEGLRLIHDLADQHWDHLHPALDPDDSDGAASLRIMRLKNLGDRSRIVRALRQVPLAESRLHGGFSLGDAKTIAQGMEAGEDGAADRHAAMLDTFQNADVDQLMGNLAAAGSCREKLAAIADLIDERSDVQEDLGLGGVEEALVEIRSLIEEHLDARGISPDQASDADALETETGGADEDDQTGQLPTSPAMSNGSTSNPVAAASRGPITSRADAVKSLDLVCRYFEQHEPSSPVPLLLRRAKRLIAKDFMAILKDLAPDGLDEAEKIVGGAGSGSGGDDDEED
jgi:type VI secretion system protein ImpA